MSAWPATWFADDNESLSSKQDLPQVSEKNGLSNYGNMLLTFCFQFEKGVIEKLFINLYPLKMTINEMSFEMTQTYLRA